MKTLIKNRSIQFLEQWLITLLTGFSLFFVLFVYQGYGIQTGLSFSGHSHLTRCLAFGYLTSLVFYLAEFHMANFLSLKSEKDKLLLIAFSILIGAHANYLLFNYFWNWTEWHWSAYWLIVLEYVGVVFFPILGVKMLFWYPSQHPPVSQPRLKFISENGKHVLSVDPENLLYLRSADNYVEVFYCSNNQLKCQLLRNSLKNIAAAHLESPYLRRCHRSYMVNPTKINHLIQANQQIQLYLGHATVPVSKKYQAHFIME